MISNKHCMEYGELLNKILEKFKKLYTEYVVNRILRSSDGAYFINLIKKGYEPHGLLLFLLVKAGFDLGIITLPEFKVAFKRPIDRCDLGLSCSKKRKPIKSVKADVVFHITSQDIGIGEVISGLLHYGFPSKELQKYYKEKLKRTVIEDEVTIRDKLLHLAKHNSEVKFFVLIIFIGKEEKRHLGRERREWIKIWKEKTIDELSKIKPTKALFIRGIEKTRFEIYP